MVTSQSLTILYRKYRHSKVFSRQIFHRLLQHSPKLCYLSCKYISNIGTNTKSQIFCNGVSKEQPFILSLHTLRQIKSLKIDKIYIIPIFNWIIIHYVVKLLTFQTKSVYQSLIKLVTLFLNIQIFSSDIKKINHFLHSFNFPRATKSNFD